MDSEMSFRQMNLNVFQGAPIPHPFFQPRIEPWYAWHQTFDQMPPLYRDLSMRELFDQLGVSMRYVHYYTGMPDPIVRSFDAAVRVHENFGETDGTRTYETPFGELTETFKFTTDKTWREVKFPVKTAEDLVKCRWLFEHMVWSFSAPNFEQGSAFVGERGVPQFWVPKSPYQALAQQWMKLQDLIYALHDCPQVVEDTMKAIDDSYDKLYQELTSYGGLQIVNFGENIHDQLFSPRYFERYLIPFYEKRCAQLREAGVYTHVHIDGYFRTLLPYLRHLPFDGLEALTPQPQGDVTLEEMAEHIGDKILLDGIPAILFMSTYSREELMQTAERVVELFHPRLVLGISDEVPEGTSQEAMERVRLIAEWCRSH
jgi:hypothetical protein